MNGWGGAVRSLPTVTYVWHSFVIDGGGSAIGTGVKGDMVVVAGVIVEVRLLADQTGSIVVDLYRDSYANFPPTSAVSVTGGNKPTLSSATKYQDTALVGWSPACADGDVIRVNVDSAATVQRCTVAVKIRKT